MKSTKIYLCLESALWLLLILLASVSLCSSYVLSPVSKRLISRKSVLTKSITALDASNATISYVAPKYKPTYYKVGYKSWKQMKARRKIKTDADDMKRLSDAGTSSSIWSNYVELVKTLAKSGFRLDYLRHFVQISNASCRMTVGEEMGNDIPRYSEIKLEQDLRQSIGEIFKPKKNKGLGT